MANLPLGFALTLGGGVLLTAGLSGKTITDVLTGQVSASDVTSAAPGTAGNPLTGGSSNPLAPGNPATAPPFTDPFPSSTQGAGAGAAAGAAEAASGALAPPPGSVGAGVASKISGVSAEVAALRKQFAAEAPAFNAAHPGWVLKPTGGGQWGLFHNGKLVQSSG
jgi:hypothetical protein